MLAQLHLPAFQYLYCNCVTHLHRSVGSGQLLTFRRRARAADSIWAFNGFRRVTDLCSGA
jgi:hypothetical protein